MKTIHDATQIKTIKTIYLFLNPLECSPGYSGPNCTIQCPYPSYGDGCHGICDCYMYYDSCDFATGCTLLTTGTYLNIPGLDIQKCKKE